MVSFSSKETPLLAFGLPMSPSRLQSHACAVALVRRSCLASLKLCVSSVSQHASLLRNLKQRGKKRKKGEERNHRRVIPGIITTKQPQSKRARTKRGCPRTVESQQGKATTGGEKGSVVVSAHASRRRSICECSYALRRGPAGTNSATLATAANGRRHVRGARPRIE